MAFEFTGTLPHQTWGVGQRIVPVAIPSVQDASGAVTYSASNVPVGVIVDFSTQTIYGTPASAADASAFLLSALDASGAVAEMEVEYTIVAAPLPIRVDNVPDLRLRIGDPVDYRFPVPRGGSGQFTTALEYRPTGPLAGGRVHRTSLPDGLNFSDGRLTGTVRDNPANRGASIAQTTLRTGRTGAGRNSGRIGPANSLTSESFNYPALTGPVYRWGELRTFASGAGVGRMLFSTTPDIVPVLPNSPSLYIVDPHAPEEPLRRLPLALARQQRPGLYTWGRTFGQDFRFAPDTEYYVELVTSSTSTFDYVVTDALTGEQVRRPFTLSLTTTPSGAPSPPVLAQVQPTQNAVDVYVQPADDPAIDSIRAVAVYSGFPWDEIQLQQHPYENRVQNHVRLTGLQPAEEYDLYLFYSSTVGLSAPTTTEFETLAIRQVAVPQPIHNLQAAPGNNVARLTWDQLDHFQLVSRFEISVDGRPWQPIPFSNVATSAYTQPGLVNGTAVTLSVRAVNEAGPGPSASVQVTPDEDAPVDLLFSTRIQCLVQIDVGGVPLELSQRVISIDGEFGRQPGSLDFASGGAVVEVRAKDGFIRLSEAGSARTGVYTADDIRNRQLIISEIYETASGQLEVVPRFGGWIETAIFTPEGDYTRLTLTVVDQIAQYARTPIRFVQPIPEEYAHQRLKRMLLSVDIDPADPDSNILIDDDFHVCGAIVADRDSPYEGTLLDELSKIALSTGGRLFVEQNQTLADEPRVGRFRYQARSPVLQIKATLSDDPDEDALDNPSWTNLIQMGNRPSGQPNASTVYNVINWTLPDGSQLTPAPKDQQSVSGDGWGERLFPVSDVVVNELDALGTARYYLRVFSQPRLETDHIHVYQHFQDPTAALALARSTFADAVRLSTTPLGARAKVIQTQRIDRIHFVYSPGDKQYIQVFLDIGLLSPEATAYWIVSHPDEDRLGVDSYLSLPQPGDDDVLGNFDWHYEDDDVFRAVVSSTRYDRLLASQAWPTYSTTAERDRIETDPGDGWATIIAGGTIPNRFIRWEVWSQPDNQWLVRGEVTTADANPSTSTMVWDTDEWDSGKTWAA